MNTTQFWQFGNYKKGLTFSQKIVTTERCESLDVNNDFYTFIFPDIEFRCNGIPFTNEYNSLRLIGNSAHISYSYQKISDKTYLLKDLTLKTYEKNWVKDKTIRFAICVERYRNFYNWASPIKMPNDGEHYIILDFKLNSNC